MSSGSINIPAFGAAAWKEPVATAAALPLAANRLGDTRITLDSSSIYTWSGSAWVFAGGSTSVGGVGAFGSTPNNAGASVVGSLLVLQPADKTHPGSVSIADYNTLIDKQSPYLFSYPADGSLSDSDIGKLLMDDGSNTAKVYQSGVLTPGSAVLTISSPATPAESAVQAHYRLFFHSQPTAGETVGIFGRDHTNTTRWYDWTFVTGTPSSNEIQIGIDLATTISNVISTINAQSSNPTNPVVSGMITLTNNEPGEDSITITAGSLIPGTDGNWSFTSQVQGMFSTFDQVVPGGNSNWSGSATSPFVNLSGSMEYKDTNYHASPVNLGPSNGSNAVAASTASLSDALFGSIFNLTAGVDWTPAGSANAEATAIAAASASAITAAGWSQSVISNVITYTNNTSGTDSVSASLGGGVTDWATFVPTDGVTPSSTAFALGKLADLVGAVATIAPTASQSFIATGVISQGAYLSGSNDGTVQAGNPSTDFIIGKALFSVTNGELLSVAYSPSEPVNWFGSGLNGTPLSIPMALEWLWSNAINTHGGYIQGGPLTVDNSSTDVTNINLITNSGNSNAPFTISQSGIIVYFAPSGFLNVGAQSSSTKTFEQEIVVDYGNSADRSIGIRNTSDEAWFYLELSGKLDIGLTGAHDFSLFTNSLERFTAKADGSLDCHGGQLTNAGFVAGDASKWAGSPPTTIQEAIDRIAAVVGATIPIP